MVWRRRRYRYHGGYYKSQTQRKIEALCEAKDFEAYANEVFGIESPHINSIGCLREILYHTSEEFHARPEFSEYYGVALTRFLEKNISTKKTRSWGKPTPHNYDYPNLISESAPYLNEKTKGEIVDQIIKYGKNFYANDKRTLLDLAIGFSEPNDYKAIGLFKEFYRIVNDTKFNQLMEKIPGGADNPDVRAILSKTKLFDHFKYTEKSIEDKKTKIKLTKALAKTPTLIKKIPFKVHIEFDHLKEIAPAMRFKFMQFAFKHEIDQSKWRYHYGGGLKSRIRYYKARHKEQNLVMPDITVEQMKELLFSVCLSKNAEFVKWIGQYETYLKCVNSDVKINLSD